MEFQLMKNRQGFQVIDGFRQSTAKPAKLRVSLAQGVPTDITETLPFLLREQVGGSLAEALTASEQRLSALLQDRKRIGRELHDSVLQALYTIVLTLEQTPGLRKEVLQTGPHVHNQAADQLHTLIQDIRRMILRVESGCVDPFRLVSELQALAQTVERVSEVQVRVEVDQAAEEILTGEEARELITIAREALSNCVCHARATRIVVALQRIGSRVQLRVRDNGLGFDVEHGPAKGIGFAHMEDRVRKIGGRLEVQSTVGRGTCIIAHVYLEPILATI
jgi:signal transduction histidine kinase